MSLAEIISASFTAVGALCCLGVFVLNLSLKGAMLKMQNMLGDRIGKVELDVSNMSHLMENKISGVNLELSKMQTSIVREQASMYEKILHNMTTQYMGRKESEQMHLENRNRIDRIEREVEDIKRSK